MTIPKITPYSGGVANPDGSQTQTEFTQNMFDQLGYEAELSTELNNTVDGINDTATQVDADATSAAQSASAAEAAVSGLNYQGLWPDTGGSANKGDTYQTQVSGTPTGQYFTALQNTTVDPVGDDVNWREVVSGSSIGVQEVIATGSTTPRRLDDRFADVVHVKDFGFGGNASENASAISLAIDAAELINNKSYNAKPTGVEFPSGQYEYDATVDLSKRRAALFCKGNCKLTYTGDTDNPAIEVGDETSNSGYNTSSIQNIHFFDIGLRKTGVGMKLTLCSLFNFKNSTARGFDVGIHCRGTINIMLDFERSFIRDNNTDLIIESIKAPGGGLRFAANLTKVRNGTFGSPKKVVIRPGAGAPSGAGGGIAFYDCNFELGDTDVGISLQYPGEVFPGYEPVTFSQCWFEKAGDTIFDLHDANVLLDNCFFAGVGTNVFRMNSANDRIKLVDTGGYFNDMPPAQNNLVTLAGSSDTGNKYSRVTTENTFFSMLRPGGGGHVHLLTFNTENTKLLTRTTGGKDRLQPMSVSASFGANYPPGNVDRYSTNYDLDVAAYVVERIGADGWNTARLTIWGDNGASKVAFTEFKVVNTRSTHLAIQTVPQADTGASSDKGVWNQSTGLWTFPSVYNGTWNDSIVTVTQES